MLTNNATYPTQPPVAIVQQATANYAQTTAVKIAGLKVDIGQLWASGKQNRVEIGCKLSILQDELANPGHGTFLDALKELGIKRSTAYAYIAEYKGKPARLSKRRKDELVRVSRPEAKEVLGPFVSGPLANPAMLITKLRGILQTTANDLLMYAGSDLTVKVFLKK